MLNTVILADNIQKYRKARGLTQNELAQSLSISPQAISKWERGASVPDIENLCLMAERLEVSVDTLLGGSYATEKAMIAVDGGTSKTEFILFTEHGTLLHRLLLGGCNPNVIGIDGACQVLREGLDDLFKRHAFVCGVYIGASGFGTQDNARLIASQLQKVYPHIKLRCTSDIFNVIATATSSEQCLAAICGTGAVVFAKKGETLTRFGGWGYLFEEGGSGYAIGKAAICAALQEEDGLEEKSLLTQLVQDKLGSTAWGSLHRLYGEPPAFIADFAPLVFQAHARADSRAERILEEHAGCLARLINHAFHIVRGDGPLVLSGSILTSQTVFLDMLKARLDPSLPVLVPAVAQVYGACLLCCRLCKLPTGPLAETFCSQYASFVSGR